MNDFSAQKNSEIEEMMPPEFDRFDNETRQFFAAQQGENFKLKKELVTLQKEVEDLKSFIEQTTAQLSSLEHRMEGDEPPHVQMLEQNFDKESAS